MKAEKKPKKSLAGCFGLGPNTHYNTWYDQNRKLSKLTISTVEKFARQILSVICKLTITVRSPSQFPTVGSVLFEANKKGEILSSPKQSLSLSSLSPLCVCGGSSSFLSLTPFLSPSRDRGLGLGLGFLRCCYPWRRRASARPAQ